MNSVVISERFYEIPGTGEQHKVSRISWLVQIRLQWWHPVHAKSCAEILQSQVFHDAIQSQYLWSLLSFFRCDRDGKKQGKSDGGRSCLWTSQTAPQMPSLQTTAVHYPTVKGSSQETLAEMQKIILQPVYRFQAKRKTWKCQWACIFFCELEWQR